MNWKISELEKRQPPKDKLILEKRQPPWKNGSHPGKTAATLEKRQPPKDKLILERIAKISLSLSGCRFSNF